MSDSRLVEVELSDPVLKKTETLVDDSISCVNLDEPVELVSNDDRASVVIRSSHRRDVANILPPDRPWGDLSTATAVDDKEQPFALEELKSHYGQLLSRGYRATRWEHPRFGVEERLPSGQWRSTLPDGVVVETTQDGFMVSGARSVTIRSNRVEDETKDAMGLDTKKKGGGK